MSEMADVTYADLKFVPYGKKSKCSEPQQAGSEEEEDGEITYENLKGPQISESKANPEPARPGKEGFSVLKARSPQIALILLVACVCLLATSIALGVQLMQVSKQMSEDYETLNSNFSQSRRLRDEVLKDTENKLQETSDSLGKVLQKLNHTQQHLEDMMKNFSKTQDMLISTEKELSNRVETIKAIGKERDELNSALKTKTEEFADCALIECCPEGWILVSGECLYFSTKKDTWKKSQHYCEYRYSSLLNLTNKDSQVKKYIQEKCQTSWGSPSYYSSYHKCIWYGGSEKVYHILKNSGEISNHTISPWSEYYWICSKSAHFITFQKEFPFSVVNYMNCAWKTSSLS